MLELNLHPLGALTGIKFSTCEAEKMNYFALPL